ncbi:DUF2059 domain-containing protein [Teredinibacter turnerae]|uniref:DUF2059 domain-containing protein n=1 Tax=Teredinibacter turnerae TaxID=2426 RepID=UPI00036544EB|nr:hypothetical protein [Teredinibacter turnerae]
MIRHLLTLSTTVIAATLIATLGACSKPENTQSNQPPGRVIKAGTTQVDELLDKSRLNQQISQLPAMVLAATDDQLRRGVVEVDKVRAIFSETYNPADLRYQARSYLLDHLDEAELNKILAWLDSALGKKVSAETSLPGSPSARSKVMGPYPQLSANKARLKQVQELETYQRATDDAVDLHMAIRKSLQLAINQSLPEERRISEAEFLADDQNMRPQLETRMKQSIEATNLYNLQSLSDSELNEYIAFSQSDIARTYRHALSEALQAALKSAGKKAGLKLAALNAG